MGAYSNPLSHTLSPPAFPAKIRAHIKLHFSKKTNERSGRERVPAILAVGGKCEGVAKREPL
jgi:hypothetical protein